MLPSTVGVVPYGASSLGIVVVVVEEVVVLVVVVVVVVVVAVLFVHIIDSSYGVSVPLFPVVFFSVVHVVPVQHCQ